MGSPANLFVRDTFQDEDSTPLQDHAPDTGGNWAKAFDISSDGTIVDNMVANPTASGYVSYVNATPTEYDGDGELTVYLKYQIPNPYTRILSNPIKVNVDTDDGDYYDVDFESGLIFRYIGGISDGTIVPTPDVGNRTPATPVAGAEHEIVVRVTNTGSSVDFEIYLDGELWQSASDTSPNRIAAAGKVGFSLDGATGVRAFEVIDFAAFDGFQLTPYEPPPPSFWAGFRLTREE